MSMKTKQINKMKVEVFEEKELIEKLRLNKEQINLILTYQEKFPELLQKQKDNEFLIDARSLWKQLNQPQGNFADFAKRDIVEVVFKEKGRKTKEKKYKENTDYIRNRNFAKGDKNGHGNKTTTEYKLTVKCAKKISMQQGNKIGDVVQDYFILMEETLRNYESWDISRGLEKKGWNEMKQCVKDWCMRKGYDYNDRVFYIREANLINQSLLGYSASEINWLLNNNDRITRNHLSTSINKAIQNLQQLNQSLLFNDISFEQRKQIIETTCKNKYSELKVEFLNVVA